MRFMADGLFQLDICDLTQPFGITAVQMTLSSEPLMTALLGLSDACVIHKNMGNQQTSYLSRIDQWTRPLWSESFTLTAENALAAVLEETRWLVTDIAQTWKNMQKLRTRNLELLAHQALDPGIASSIYWMFFRLGSSQNFHVSMCRSDQTRLECSARKRQTN